MGIFNKIQLKKPPYSVFDMSYDHKLSFKMGKLVPVHVQECLPGDSWRVASEGMFRMMPMIAPIMHRVDIFMHHFFVPNRILWPNWRKWITGGETTGLSAPAFPVIPATSFTNGPSSLANYLGIPTQTLPGGTTEEMINALPFAAYQRIWAEYYRDQNLEPLEGLPFGITGSEVQLTDGAQDALFISFLNTLRDRAWEHDYFTSCLPFAQKGTGVDLPIELVGNAPVSSVYDAGQAMLVKNLDESLAGSGDLMYNLNALTDGGGVNKILDPNERMAANLNDVGVGVSTTINDLRTAFGLQKWLEKNARGGSRYIESILAHFGVRSSDKRLSRPEYLGGTKASMAISEVLQTSSTDAAVTPQGNMAGHGIGIAGGKDYSYYCEEHGYIIGVLSVRPRTAYYQGLPRHFSKSDKMDYYWPDFAFLGEQEVKNKEVYVQSAYPNTNNDTFGYIPRYSEYRYNSSRVSGQMADTLDNWHMARKFSSTPALNAAFVKSDPTKRIYAVTDANEDDIVAHIHHNIIAKRPLPKYGSPGGI